MSLDSNKFLKQMSQKKEEIFRLANVTEVTEGQVYITFYGEDSQSEKPYKILSSYNPAVGDVVCVAKINTSWLILGKIGMQYANGASGIPTDHASTATTYGKGTGSRYGHVKLSDSTSSDSDTEGGAAATPKAVKAAYDLANKKVASARGSASSLSLTAGTITALTLDTWIVRSDAAFTFDDGGIKCPNDGNVLITGNIYFRSSTSEASRRGVYIYKNGTEVLSQYLDANASGAGAVGSGVSIIPVSAGDVITLNARQKTATTCAPSNNATSLVVAYV